MKQIKTAILTIAAALTLSSCNYNGMVEREEAVSQAWSNVENQYQRRADLIPNLVNTVKGYAAHEQEAIDSVTAAREKLAGASTVEEKAEADQALTAALNNLLVKSLHSFSRTISSRTFEKQVFTENIFTTSNQNINPRWFYNEKS